MFILEEFALVIASLLPDCWGISVQPLFLVKWIETLISGSFASFKGGEPGLSSLSTVSFPASNLSRQIHFEHAPSNVSRRSSVGKYISNEQTIRFEPVLHHLDTSSPRLSFSPRGKLLPSTNLNLVTIYLLRGYELFTFSFWFLAHLNTPICVIIHMVW